MNPITKTIAKMVIRGIRNGIGKQIEGAGPGEAKRLLVEAIEKIPSETIDARAKALLKWVDEHLLGKD